MKTMLSCSMSLLLLLGCRTTNTNDASAEKAVNNQWCKAKLTSRDGVQISIDFRVVWDHGFVATPVWLNVSGASLKSHNAVNVFVQSYAEPSGHPQTEAEKAPFEKRQVNLLFDSRQNKFTKEVPGGLIVISEDMSGQTRLAQTVQVSVDGRALIDPINGTDKFQVQLYKTMNAQNCR